MPTDLSRLRRQVVSVQDEAPIAAREGVQLIAHGGLAEMTIIGPRDTGRYVRQIAQANNALPMAPRLPVLVVKESRYLAQMEARLSKQVHRLTRYVAHARAAEKKWQTIFRDRYEFTGRKGRWRADCQRKLQAAQKQAERMEGLLRRAIEEEQILDAGGKSGAIVIGGRKTKKFGASNLSTVRAMLYGGDAVVVQSKGRAGVVAHFKEPHSSIIESRLHVIARAKASAARRQLTAAQRAMNSRMTRAGRRAA